MCVHLFLILPHIIVYFDSCVNSTHIMTLFVAASIAICSVDQYRISIGIQQVAEIVLCISLSIEETWNKVSITHVTLFICFVCLWISSFVNCDSIFSLILHPVGKTISTCMSVRHFLYIHQSFLHLYLKIGKVLALIIITS